jgi:phosphoribosylanthranilate isomerase
MIKVKVCGLSDPLNVKEIAETKPDFMGFIFFRGSSRYVGEEPDRLLFLNVPDMISAIGVFVNEDPLKIINLAKHSGLGMIQLHGTESPDYCRYLSASGLKIIKAFSVFKDFDFEKIKQYMPGCDYFLFDTKSEKPGGSGRKFNWEKLKEYSLDKPFILSGGIGPEDSDLIKSIENRGFFAVDVNSRFETATGIKDVALVKTFIRSIKNDQL